MKPTPAPTRYQKGSFHALHRAGMRNGSVFRITGRKREFAAQYINGDFIRFVRQDELPEGLDFYLPKREALDILPPCFH